MTLLLDEFSSISVGSRWASAVRVLTENELTAACALSGDWHPIHADAAFAASTSLGQRVFQGGFGLLVALGAATHFPALGGRNALALGVGPWSFLKPLFINDRVFTNVEIAGIRRTSDNKKAVLEKRIQLVKESGEVALEGSTTSLIFLSEEHGDFARPVNTDETEGKKP